MAACIDVAWKVETYRGDRKCENACRKQSGGETEMEGAYSGREEARKVIDLA